MKKIILSGVALLTAACILLTGCDSLNTPLAIERTDDSASETVRSSDIEVDTSAATASGSSETKDDRPDSEVTGISIRQETSTDTEQQLQTQVRTLVYEYELTPVEYKKKDVVSSYDKADTVRISLKKDSINVNGPGVTPDGSTATITSAGEYLVTGELKDGQIVIDAGDSDDVRLILSGVTINCTYSAPIYCRNADKLIITLDEGTVNTLTDADTMSFSDEDKKEPNATLFSASDLTINGAGQLDITAGYQHGIRCKDELKLISGVINVTAADNGIKAKKGIIVRSGTVTVISEGDGIRTGSDEDPSKGYAVIEGGIISVTSALDGIQAGASLEIINGTLNIVTGGGSGNSSTGSTGGFGWGIWGNSKTSDKEKKSAKGLKSAGGIFLMDGTVNIDSSDDGIHSDQNVMIAGGALKISSGDDGLHASGNVVINGGSVDIIRSYEGIEGLTITVNDGTVSVVAEDDGFNTAGGDGSSAVQIGGRMRMSNPFAVTEGAVITINGGRIYVDAEGDGLDSNGDLYMNGGTVMIDGPTRGGNGALDHNGTAQITGGTIVASGSSDMIENFDDTSTQNVLLIFFEGTVGAGTAVVIRDRDGGEVLSFTTGKSSQCAIVSCPAFRTGETYSVEVGGRELASLTIGSVVTSNGSTRGYGGGFGGPGRPGGFGRK